MSSPFFQILQDYCKVQSDKVFITDATTDKINTITVSQFCELVNERISSLQPQEIPENSAIAVGRVSALDSLINIFAIWGINCVPVMVNTMLSDEEQIKLIRFTKSALMITEGKDTQIQEFSVKKVRKDISYPNYTAVVIFSSGSTDTPKAVPLSYENLLTAYRNGNEKLHYDETDIWLLSLPQFHISGFSIVVRALLSGASIIICNNAVEFFHSTQKDLKDSVTHTSLVSTQLHNLLSRSISPPNSLKYTLLGGGPIPAELAVNANDSGWNICKVYGSTETSAFVTALLPIEIGIKSFSVGKPLNNVSIRIIGQDGRVLPSLSIGEVAIKSPSISSGYFNGEVVESFLLQDGYFLTGDLGYIDEQGYLYIEGRKKRVIISGGENIDVDEVEKVIKNIDGVSDCIAFGVESEKWGEELAVAIAIKPERNISEVFIKNFLRNKIAAYKIPKKILIVDNLPRNELGKVMYGELKRLLK